MKTGKAIKWVAIFLILSVWTAIVITGVPSGSLTNVQAAVDTEGPIYIQDGSSFDELEKLDLLNY